jgi:hypothetical protein
LYAVNPSGKLLFYRQLKTACLDFRPHNIKGQTFYSYLAATEGVLLGVALVGTRVILNSDFEEIDRIPGSLDSHEFLMFGKENYLAIQNELKRLPNGFLYIDKRVREFEKNKITFDWGISDLFEQFKSTFTAVAYASKFNGQLVWEVVHLNSVQKLKNGDFILGLGDSGTAYVNHKTKKVDWILGGTFDEFGLSFEQLPHFQHTAWFDVSRNSLLLFSNTNIGSPHGLSSSRVIEYQIDPKKKKLKAMKVIRSGKESVSAMGSVQKVGDVYSLTFGFKLGGSKDFYAEMKEGKDVFGFHFTDGKLWYLYRVYRGPMGEPQ